jgi:hypothetical protein
MHNLAQDRHDSRMAIFQSGNESAKGRALTAHSNSVKLLKQEVFKHCRRLQSLNDDIRVQASDWWHDIPVV